jgi:hypothetical protein
MELLKYLATTLPHQNYIHKNIREYVDWENTYCNFHPNVYSAVSNIVYAKL